MFPLPGLRRLLPGQLPAGARLAGDLAGTYRPPVRRRSVTLMPQIGARRGLHPPRCAHQLAHRLGQQLPESDSVTTFALITVSHVRKRPMLSALVVQAATTQAGVEIQPGQEKRVLACSRLRLSLVTGTVQDRTNEPQILFRSAHAPLARSAARSSR